LYSAREYFRAEGSVMGGIAVLFVLQALGFTLALDHGGWRGLVFVPLAVTCFLAGPLLFARPQVRRWWREAGEVPSWRGGAVRVSVVSHLLLVALMELFIMPLAIYGGGFVWSVVMGFLCAAGLPLGLSRAIAREERRSQEVLLVGLHSQALFQIQAPDLWLRGRLQVTGR
jgi:hypothetical protein